MGISEVGLRISEGCSDIAAEVIIIASGRMCETQRMKTERLRTTEMKLYVKLSASEVRRRLKGHGLGVRRIESAGKGRALIVHTATGKHLRQLESLFQDAVESSESDEPADDAPGDLG